MKRLLIFLMLTMSLAMTAQTTPSYANVKLTKLPVGNLHDSVVLTNGSTKLLKYLPVSQIKGTANLDATASPTGITVFSSTGNDAILPLSTTTNAGLQSPSDKTKLNGIETGATANQTDAYLLSRANQTGTQPISTVVNLQNDLDSKANLSGAVFSGDVQVPAIPVNANSAIAKTYLDNALTGITWKNAVRAATTANITLVGTQTIDGIAVVSGNRVLVKNQTDAKTNGIYSVDAGTWTRVPDVDSSSEITTATVVSTNGTLNKNTQWTCSTPDIILGTTDINFSQIAGAGTYANGTGLLLSGNTFLIDGTVTTLSGVQTLTNKTITSPLGITTTDVTDVLNKRYVTDENVTALGTLAANLAAKANDSDVVKLTGNQNVAGTKTFDAGEIKLKGQISGTVGRLFKQNDIFVFEDSAGRYAADFASGSLGVYKSDGNYARFYANIITGNRDFTIPDQSGTLALTSGVDLKVDKNAAITGATNTKITYDSKGLVTAGTSATTADINPSTNRNYVTDAQATVIGNTSGTNTGDNATNSLYSGLVSNATHTGDATGSTALTVVKINGTSLAGLATGLLKNTTGTGVPSIAVSGTDIKTVGGVSILGSGDIPMSLPAPFVATTSTNGRINGELNIGPYATLKINTTGTAGANPNYADYTANTSSGGGGWFSGHRFYAGYGSSNVLSLTIDNNGAANSIVTAQDQFKALGLTTLKNLNAENIKGLNYINLYNNLGNSAISESFVSISNPEYITTHLSRTQTSPGWSAKVRYRLVTNGGSTIDYMTVNEVGGGGGTDTSTSANIVFKGNVKSEKYSISALNTAPSSSTDTGTLGEIRITAAYIYVCTATNTWVRTALATW